MKKRLLFITIFFLIGAFIIYFITEPKVEKWIYELPNDYVIKKTSDTDVILGKYIDDSFEVKTKEKQIGVVDYIAEFSYSENYIALKCLEPTDDSVKVKFYIVDTKNEDIYGPYHDQETYNAVSEEIVEEELTNWIETINKPKGAINK